MTKPKHLFSSDGTYVIAGGLGGLGRSIARWMVEHGAQNLILLSRSGPKSGVAKSLIHELKAQGIRVATPLVDIGNFDHLREVLDGLAKSMPAILGCIQATIALRVGFLYKRQICRFPDNEYQGQPISKHVAQRLGR